MASLNIVIFYCLAANYPGVEDYTGYEHQEAKMTKGHVGATDYSCLAETQAHKLLLVDDAATTTDAIEALVTHGTTHCYDCHSQMNGLPFLPLSNPPGVLALTNTI